jgi:hypothetical protein
MKPPILMIDLGDLVGLACALLLMSVVGLWVLADKLAAMRKKRKNRQ